MYLKLKSPATFFKCLKCMQELGDTAYMECTPKGVFLQVVEDSNVSMAQFEIRKDGEDAAYECTTKFSVGLPLKAITGMLACMQASDSLVLTMEEPYDVMVMTNHAASGGRQGTWVLKLADMDSDRVVLTPVMEYFAEIVMPSDTLRTVIQSYLQSDSLSITVNGDEKSLEFASGGMKASAGSDYPSGTVKLLSKPDSAKSVTLRKAPKGISKVSIGSQFLTCFSKANTIVDTVRIFIHHEDPMRVRYDIPTLGYLQFILALRLDARS
eukprot:PhF_6_TR30768/c0_g1_i1/m.45319/K04802/PCNA; proliferating cell nuclear antigen